MTTIAHISDLHFGTHTDSIMKALLDDLALMKPDITCVSGDLTQRAIHREYIQARDFIAQIATPTVVIPGNHDIPLYNIVDRLFSPFRMYRKYIGSTLQPVVQEKDVAFICLNTSRGYFWKQGIIWPWHRSHLVKTCRELPEDTVKIVVVHHPCLLPAGCIVHRRVRGWKRALEDMALNGVELLLSGHVHVAGQMEYKFEPHPSGSRKSNVIVSAAGTALSGRTRFEYQSYNYIIIDDDVIHIHTRLWNGNIFDESTSRSFCRHT